jgi:DNA transposition AAA+ family ATPase
MQVETNRIAELEDTAPPAGPSPTSHRPTTDQSTASSAHSRINIPLNVENWARLDQPTQDALLWLHQHLLDSRLSWEEAEAALSYDRSTIFKILKGTYEGSWANVVDRIMSYRRLAAERGAVQRQEFSENGITRLIFGALNYAVANNTITLIEGESRMGKTTSALAWRDANNHGRSVYVVAPAYGGTKALLRDIAAAIGVNKNLSTPQMHEAILRGFNRNRILIVDEAHRLLPNDRRTNPVLLEILRDIHDRTGCALALLSTTRFGAELRKTDYMFEQLLGRIELPVRLKRKVGESDILPILRQFMAQPAEAVVEEAVKIANERGRLGVLIGVLKIASRMVKGKRNGVTQEVFFKAMTLRNQMMGEQLYAAK